VVGAKSVAAGFKTARAFSTVTVAVDSSGAADDVFLNSKRERMEMWRFDQDWLRAVSQARVALRCKLW